MHPMPARAREAPSPDTLSFLLQDVRQGRVSAQGVKLGGRWYWSDELALLVGARVTVRGWPGAEWAFVYSPDDRVIAVRPKPLADWQTADGPANRLARRGAKAQRAYLGAVRRELRALALAALQGDGRPAPTVECSSTVLAGTVGLAPNRGTRGLFSGQHPCAFGHSRRR